MTKERNEVLAEWSWGFQEYMYKDSGERVPHDTPIGYEIEGDDQLHLYENIVYGDESWNDDEPDNWDLKNASI